LRPPRAPPIRKETDPSDRGVAKVLRIRRTNTDRGYPWKAYR